MLNLEAIIQCPCCGRESMVFVEIGPGGVESADCYSCDAILTSDMLDRGQVAQPEPEHEEV